MDKSPIWKWNSIKDIEKTFEEILNSGKIPEHFNENLEKSLSQDRFLKDKFGSVINDPECLSKIWTIDDIKNALKSLKEQYNKVYPPSKYQLNPPKQRKPLPEMIKTALEKEKSSNEMFTVQLRKVLQKSRETPRQENFKDKIPIKKRLSEIDDNVDTTEVQQEIIPKSPLKGNENLEKVAKENPENVSNDNEPPLQIKIKPRISRQKVPETPEIGKSTKIVHKDYLQVRPIIEKPSILVLEYPKNILEILPYILQNLKMWGGHILRPEIFTQILSNQCKPVGNVKSPFSRIDAICTLVENCDYLVQVEIIRLLSLFSIPIPLIAGQNGQFKFYGDLIVDNCTVKWSYGEDFIQDNYIFKDPYKLLVVFRVGEGRGKSKILNQMFASKHTFSNCDEPKASFGKPRWLDGLVEMIPILENNCDPVLWEFLCQNYQVKDGPLLLMANVHGNILKPENLTILKFLQKIAQNYMVFYMPSILAEFSKISNDLKEICGPNFKEIILYQDHLSEEFVDKISIDLNYITNEDTLLTIKEEISKIFLEKSAYHEGFENFEKVENFQNICRIDNPVIPSVDLLTNFIKLFSCKGIKSDFKLQVINPYDGYPPFNDIKSNKNLMIMLNYWSQILNLPLDMRKRAIQKIEMFLQQTSGSECQLVRMQFQNLKSKLLEARKKNPQNVEIIQLILKEIEENDKHLSLSNLGFEHFFREFGCLYDAYAKNYEETLETEEISQISNFPQKCAELLMEGQALELFDGDISTINKTWMNAVCHHICEKIPNLRVYVVSIIGLQSSGKSTLLNAIFACKFAVSVGRCTKGIFMRLLHLSEELKAELNADALILIDTEGLSSPEKFNDPQAEVKDRKMATFAMSISNLMIINVLAEVFHDINEILQIVIVTIASLDKVKIMAPDILLVKHVNEKNILLIEKSIETFKQALNEAVKLAETKNVEIGIKNSRGYQNLIKRLQSNELLKQIGTFKSGDSVNSPPSVKYHEDVVDLYKIILKNVKLQEPLSFHVWHEILGEYWDALETEDFALRFKCIREIQEYLVRNEKILKIKDTIDLSFEFHKEKILKQLDKEIKIINIDRLRNKESQDLVKNELFIQFSEAISEVPKICTNNDCAHCKVFNENYEDLLSKHRTKNKKIHDEIVDKIEKYIAHGLNAAQVDLAKIFEMDFLEICQTKLIDDLINDIVKNTLNTGINLQNEQVRSEIINKIWIKVKAQINTVDIGEKKNVREEIYRFFCEDYEYLKAPLIQSLVLNPNAMPPTLVKVEAFEPFNFFGLIKTSKKDGRIRCLDQRQSEDLMKKLIKATEVIIKKTGSNKLERKLTYKFISHIRSISNIFQDSHGRFLLEFDWAVLGFAIFHFTSRVEELQNAYNEKFEPSKVIKKYEDQIKAAISSKIDGGFDLAKAAHSIADKMTKSMIRNAEINSEKYLRKQILSEEWIKSTETVRVSYFTHLAQELNEGNMEKVLKHFQYPEIELTDWFKVKVVETLKSTNPQFIFVSALKEEFDEIKAELEGASDDWEHLYSIVDEYMSQLKGVTYDLDKVKEAISDKKSENFQKFLGYVLNSLEVKNENNLENLKFEYRPEDHIPMKMLGCTAICFVCKAVCWGEFDHYGDGLKPSNYHKTYHQPLGLMAYFNSESGQLEDRSCYDITDDQFFIIEGETLNWKEAKCCSKYEKWEFEPSPITFNDQLMRWFFNELQIEISQRNKVEPANLGGANTDNSNETKSYMRSIWNALTFRFRKKK